MARCHQPSRLVDNVARDENPMSCKEFVDSLQAFRDDELTSPDRIRAQEHLASCEKCSAYLHRYEQTIQVAKNTASDNADSALLPESLVRRIVAARRGRIACPCFPKAIYFVSEDLPKQVPSN
jgi:anti-sigma factor RsiW